jgi:hypothetical protein
MDFWHIYLCTIGANGERGQGDSDRSQPRYTSLGAKSSHLHPLINKIPIGDRGPTAILSRENNFLNVALCKNNIHYFTFIFFLNLYFVDSEKRDL